MVVTKKNINAGILIKGKFCRGLSQFKITLKEVRPNLFGLDKRAFKSYFFVVQTRPKSSSYLLQIKNLQGSIKLLLLRF